MLNVQSNVVLRYTKQCYAMIVTHLHHVFIVVQFIYKEVYINTYVLRVIFTLKQTGSFYFAEDFYIYT